MPIRAPQPWPTPSATCGPDAAVGSRESDLRVELDPVSGGGAVVGPVTPEPVTPEPVTPEPVTDSAQAHTPLLEAVRRESRSLLVRMGGSGHHGGARAGADLSALLGPAVLSADVRLDSPRLGRALREAEALAARAWGGAAAWLLDAGATGGNLAWLEGTLGDGEEVVVGRDAHVSVLSGLVSSGARPVWVSPRVHPRHGLPLGVAAVDVAAALDAHPGVRQVVLTSPGYATTCAPVGEVVAAARARGVHTYVDQSWGAHLAFHPDLPEDALAAGAAAAVVALDRSATALSSGAVLLLGQAATQDQRVRVDAAVRRARTSSPLLPLLASVDAARRDLALGGAEALGDALERARWLTTRLRAVPGLRVLGADELGLDPRRVDALRIVLDVGRLGLTGWEVETALRRMGTPPQGADDRRVYLSPGGVRGMGSPPLPRPGQPWPGGVLMVRALERVARRALDHEYARRRRLRRGSQAAGVWVPALMAGEQVLTPRQAVRAPAAAVALRLAVGRVAAEPVVPYPPGVPVLVPGEVIAQSVVDALRGVLATGGYVGGCADPTVATLRVVEL